MAEDIKKILIVLSDLDPLLTRVYRNKFQKHEGYETIITSSYPEALKIIKKEKPQAVLTDIILEQGNGFDLLKEIRNSTDPQLVSIPIIILTELSQMTDKQKAVELGATEYLVKSEISLTEVIERVKRTIDK